MTVDVEAGAASVAHGLAAAVLVGHSHGEVLHPGGQLMAGTAQQVLAGALEVIAVPIQRNVVGVAPSLTLSRAHRAAAQLARGKQGTLFTQPAAGGRADHGATSRAAVAALGAGGIGPEFAASLMVGAVGPAAAAAVQGHAVAGAQHKALVALATLRAGTFTQGGTLGRVRRGTAGWTGLAAELVVAVRGAFHLWEQERKRMGLGDGC